MQEKVLARENGHAGDESKFLQSYKELKNYHDDD